MNISKLFFFILIPVFLIGFFVMLSLSGPKNIDFDALAKNPSFEIPEEHEAYRLKSLSVEGQFEEILSLRDYNQSDLELLRQAIEFQELYVTALPYHSAGHQRLTLKQRYDQFFRGLVRKSLADERLIRAYDEEDYAGAMPNSIGDWRTECDQWTLRIEYASQC